MRRARLIALAAVMSACSSSFDPPARLVLLQYSSPPGAADSLAASQIGGGSVTIYPIIATMTIHTSVPVGAFAALNPKPTVTEGDNISPGCGGPSAFFITNHLVTPADSAAAALAGIRVVTYSRTRTHFSGDFERSMLTSVLSRLGGLADDANISSVQLDLSGPCSTLAVPAR